jgi:hypothetical protein
MLGGRDTAHDEVECQPRAQYSEGHDSSSGVLRPWSVDRLGADWDAVYCVSVTQNL